MLWQFVIRKLLFCLSPERAHEISMRAFGLGLQPPLSQFLRWRNTITDPRLRVRLFGLDFQNMVGLAAGFDKDGHWFDKLPCLGFSHVEIGTITGQAQPGNPRPRLFRLPADAAIINRMGFNNGGADAAARRLASKSKSNPQDILGINIGKTKIVSLEDATTDYLYSFERLFTFADYFTINVSSPNTPGLRELQNRDHLLGLLSAVMQLNDRLAADHEIDRKPVLLKIAPDVSNPQLDDIVSILKEIKLDGIIATNTTLSRDGLNTPTTRIDQIGNGGLSGQPLAQRSCEVVRYLRTHLGAETPIVGVGGIMDGEHAWQMILAGASMLQVYTGFIYGGPSFVRNINRTLIKKLDENNLGHIQEAVGLQAGN